MKFQVRPYWVELPREVTPDVWHDLLCLNGGTLICGSTRAKDC